MYIFFALSGAMATYMKYPKGALVHKVTDTLVMWYSQVA